MKRTFLSLVKPVAAILTLLVTFVTTLPAQIAVKENFDYTAGALNGQGGWIKYGSHPDSPIMVVDQTLDYTGYPGGITGNSAELKEDKNAEDLQLLFASKDNAVTTGNLYFSVVVKVNKAPTGPVYSFCFVQAMTGEIIAGKTPTEYGRVFFNKGTNDAHYKIGIDRGAQKPVYYDSELEVGKTYLLVGKYAFNDDSDLDRFALFINPAGYASEPADPAVVTQEGGKRTRGLVGFELRQGSNSKGNGPALLAGALRIADSYAGLFSENSGPSEEQPVITLSKAKLDFGTLYQGDRATDTIHVKGTRLKGDITISTGSDELTVTPSVITAAEAAGEGTDVVVTLNPKSVQGTAAITFSTEGADDKTLNASWQIVPVTEVKTLKELAAGDEESVYRYTGEAVVTFVDNGGTQPVYYLEDATAGITVKNDYEALTTAYKAGDKLSGFTGMVASAWGAVSFIPLKADLGTVVAEGQTVEPVKITLADLKANAKDYVNRLVCIENATLQNVAEGAVFAAGMTQPTIKDATGEGKLRIFKATSLIGKAVPTTAQNITGLSTSASAVIVAPRGAEDLQEAVVAEPSLTVTPDRIEMQHGLVGKKLALDTLHIKAVNLPGPVELSITGTNRDQFAASVETIPAGSSETDVIVSYVPTKIGKHQARLNIDCPALPDLTTAVSLSAYATDEKNPPVITVTPAQPEAFKAKAGETQEQTITVKTAYLPDYAYMKLKTADAFRLSTSMLMKDAETQVKVTFAPKTAGTYENEILVYALGTDTVRVKISGTATDGGATGEEKEGDSLPLDTANPLQLLDEGFNSVEKNKPLKIEGWKNLAVTGTRAWWGYTFDADGEKAAKVTPYDSKVEQGEGQPCEMLLVTPPLDFKNAKSKIFTFRVRGDYLMDNQTDKLELCYIDMNDGEMYIAPVGGFTMPATKDQSGEWNEYHIDLSGQQLADVFFMGFRFKSTRGIDNSATYYIDDVTYGRTDIPWIRTSETEVAFTAEPGKDAVSPVITVTTENLTEPVTLSLGGPNKSKFELSAKELPAGGGQFTVAFNSDAEGVHEAYVKLASRGAADIYVPLTVNNKIGAGIEGLHTQKNEAVTVYDTAGRRVSGAFRSAEEATGKLPAGTYILRITTDKGLTIKKINVR